MHTLIKFLFLIAGIGITASIIMLPIYFIRKKHNPHNSENTLKNLIIKAIIAAALILLILGSGLIAMWVNE